MILLVCAVANELAFFAPRPDVALLVTGIGPVEAATSVARRLASGDISLVVNAGIAGGFRGRAAVGDTVVVARETYPDLGREDGGALALPPDVSLIASEESEPLWVARLARAGLIRGEGITSAAVTTSDERAARFAESASPTVESMEGFAILRAARLAGVPAIELRGISNLVGDRAKGGWDIRAGIRATEHALATFFSLHDQMA